MDTSPPGLICLKSAFSVKESVDRLVHLVESKGLTVFCRIDHAANAVAAGLQLRPTEVLIFGNAKGGTPLMVASPLLALYLWRSANLAQKARLDDVAGRRQD